MALPCLAFVPGGSPSSSPATPAAATAPAHPAPLVPPPLRSLHQEPSHPPVNLFPCLIFIESRRHHKLTLSPKLSSAAELAAGSSLHLQLPCDHREDRTGVADPSPPSGPREEPPFAGVDHRSPASVRPEEEGGGGRLVKPDQWAPWTHCQ